LYFWTPFFWAVTIWLLFHSKYTALFAIGYLAYIWGPGKKAIADCSYPTAWLKNWRIWKLYSSYFPLKLVKTAELDLSERYIFVLHPHGVLSLAVWGTFATEGLDFSSVFPGIDLKICTLMWNFLCMGSRELLLSLGMVDASKKTLLKVLNKKPGRAILLAVGGAEEALLSRKGTFDLVLKKRKGFVRIALQTGANLVPVISFGETDIWTTHHVKEGKLYRAQQAFKRLTGFTVPLSHGQGLLGGKVGLLPHPVPVNTVVGAPVPVPKFTGDTHSEEFGALVDKYHDIYIQALLQLWNKYKDEYAANRVSDMRLVK
jgi:hypothetical protein